jgi:AcrR family transcriptional regulator
MPPRKSPAPVERNRSRGRPRLDIDPDAVADAVAELFAEGGLDKVSIVDAAEKLNVSRATLYRSVPTKEHLLGILFERSTREMMDAARTVVAATPDPRDQLDALLRLHVDAAIRMRGFMPVFFDGGDLPPEVYDHWRTFSSEFEDLWVESVAANIGSGDLSPGDPVVAARLLLGACIWVSRWYRADDPYDAQVIADTAINLLRQGRPAVGPGDVTR